jgi:hypothetical protein
LLWFIAAQFENPKTGYQFEQIIDLTTSTELKQKYPKNIYQCSKKSLNQFNDQTSVASNDGEKRNVLTDISEVVSTVIGKNPYNNQINFYRPLGDQFSIITYIRPHVGSCPSLFRFELF